MTSRPPVEDGASRGIATDAAEGPPPGTARRERWTPVLAIIVVALYAALLHMRPSGEGWGRGWNLLAFWLYASPAALVTGALAAWRATRAQGMLRRVGIGVALLGLLFPLVAIAVLRARA
jgi:hypothetical protein